MKRESTKADRILETAINYLKVETAAKKPLKFKNINDVLNFNFNSEYYGDTAKYDALVEFYFKTSNTNKERVTAELHALNSENDTKKFNNNDSEFYRCEAIANNLNELFNTEELNDLIIYNALNQDGIINTKMHTQFKKFLKENLGQKLYTLVEYSGRFEDVIVSLSGIATSNDKVTKKLVSNILQSIS